MKKAGIVGKLINTTLSVSFLIIFPQKKGIRRCLNPFRNAYNAFSMFLLLAKRFLSRQER